MIPAYSLLAIFVCPSNFGVTYTAVCRTNYFQAKTVDFVSLIQSLYQCSTNLENLVKLRVELSRDCDVEQFSKARSQTQKDLNLLQ